VLGFVTDAEADILTEVVCIVLRDVSLCIYESVRLCALCIKRINSLFSTKRCALTFRDSLLI
jgi:hypothetical protein